MTRKAFDEETPLPPHGKPPRVEQRVELPCSVCKQPTDGKTLSALGARCRWCFDAYYQVPMAERCAPTKEALKRRETAKPAPAHSTDDPLDLRPLRERIAANRMQP